MRRFRAPPAPVPLARFAAAPDLADAIARWRRWLGDERRVSPHTLAAYGRDLAAFLDFLVEHRGGAARSRGARRRWPPADFRACARAPRAATACSAARPRARLSVLRGFFRFLDRRGLAHNAALAAVRTPKLPRRCRRR